MKKYVKRIISGLLGICMVLGLIVAINFGTRTETVYATDGNDAVFVLDNGKFLSVKGKGYISENSIKKDYTKKRGTAQNPFIVLEVVPNLVQSQFGFFIPGCEPVDMDKATSKDEAITGIFMQDGGLKPVYDKQDGKFVNNDKFVKKVFAENGVEASSKNFTSKVVMITPEQLNHYPELIDNCDLIYFHRGKSGVAETAKLIRYAAPSPVGDGVWGDANTQEKNEAQNGGFKGHDISNEVAIRLVERLASSTPHALVYDINEMNNLTEDGTGLQMNLTKLLYMTMQYEPNYFCSKYLPQIKADSEGKAKLRYTKAKDRNGNKISADTWDKDTFRWDPDANVDNIDHMRYYAMDTNNKNVFEKLMSFNGNKSMFQCFYENYEASDSHVKYENDPHEEGAKNVTKDMFDYYENKEGKSKADENKEKRDMLDAMEFLLHGGGGTGTDEAELKLRILEIEPCNSFIYDGDTKSDAQWKYYYRSLFPWLLLTSSSENDWMNDRKKLQIDTMTVDQFVGSTGVYDYDGSTPTSSSSDDLVSKYDMIIIGSRQDASNGKDGYNDSSLKNMVYTAAGDTVGSTNKRYAPNDITMKKFFELQDFLKAGKPIVVDDGLCIKDQLDPDKVDSNSNVSRLIKWKGSDDYAGNGNNCFKRGYIENMQMRKALFGNPCNLVLTSMPAEYNGSNGSSDHTLTYKLKVKGNAGDKYKVMLHIDMDANGIYGSSLKMKSEKQHMKEDVTNDTSEYEDEGYERALPVTVANESGSTLGKSDSVTLEANKAYTVSYTLPSYQFGMIPWKLEVQKTGDKNKFVRSSVIDYTRITGKKKKIRVLQMNLSADMSTPVGGNRKAESDFVTFTDETVDISKLWNESHASGSAEYNHATQESTYKGNLNAQQKELIKKFNEDCGKVKDYNIQVKFLLNEDWKSVFDRDNADSDKVRWKDFLKGYDIILLGCQDDAQITQNQVFKAGIDDFLDKGKSVIVSHDMITTNKPSGASGDYENVMESLRKLSGQKKVDVSYAGSKFKLEDTNSKEADNAVELVLGAGGKKDRVYSSGDGKTSYIDIANNGQITTYPFKIDKQIQVAGTHQQKYRLDLEPSLKRGNNDVTVLYNLTDKVKDDKGVYSSMKGDSRNQYYLYTAGDVLYTGIGNSTAVTEDEMKLFINTLVGAFRQVDDGPRAVITNADSVSEDNKEAGIYLDFDNYRKTKSDADNDDKGEILDRRVVKENDGKEYIYIDFEIVDSMFVSSTGKKEFWLKIEDLSDPGNNASHAFTDTVLEETTENHYSPLGTVERPAYGDSSKKENRYQVTTEKKYRIKVDKEKFRKHNGKLSYCLKVYATYQKGTKSIQTDEKETNCFVRYLPLFNLE